MKKLYFLVIATALFFTAAIFTGCGNNSSIVPDNPPTLETIYKVDGAKTLQADGTADWLITGVDIYEFKGKSVDIAFSAKMKAVNKGDPVNLSWNVNITGYPSIVTASYEKGTSDWITLSEEKENLDLGDGYPKVYIGTYQVTPANLVLYIKDLEIKVTEAGNPSNTKTYSVLNESTAVTKVSSDSVPAASDDSSDKDDSEDEDDPPVVPPVADNWLADSVPSLYETYKDQFDSIGIAAEFGNFELHCSGDKYTGTYTRSDGGNPSELYFEEIQKGLGKHANSITLGNELKPQFLLQWWNGESNNTYVDFTASNGKTIKVPDKLNGESLIYATLNATKAAGVQMRGHVLTWHSQTPDGFFAENYKPTYNGSLISNMVDKETMTARHEWYIKTVLDCVENWEKANGYGTGNHIIWAWDVVNEAMADDAGKIYTGTSQDWLRGATAGTKDKSPENGGGSRWYQVYGNEEFIINAFRFANAYAPADVKLCYNDYNEYMDYELGWKTSAIEHIAQLIKDGNAETINGKSISPRLDVIAMQSHVGTSWPGVSGYESALKRFLKLCDVHVSEIDFSAESQADGTKAWSDYFKMLQNYGKNYSGAHKITNVTIWGINNESSWINPANDGGKKTYPLLFNLVNNVDNNKKNVIYNTGSEVLPQFDVGDTYKPNDAFWAVINAHK